MLSDFVPKDDELYTAFSTALKLNAKTKGSGKNLPTLFHNIPIIMSMGLNYLWDVEISKKVTLHQ